MLKKQRLGPSSIVKIIKKPVYIDMLATITCYFNPCQWENRKNNLIEFRNKFSGCDLFIIEASHENNFIYEDSMHIHAKEENKYIWQKERMLNILAESLPAKYDKIAWVDCDIVFENKSWAKDTINLLDRFNVVQLFEKVSHIGADGHPMRFDSSCGFAGSPDVSKFHPGFAWAMKRNFFPLYDEELSGGADTAMAQWFFGNFKNWHGKTALSKSWRLSGHDKSFQFYHASRGQVGCTKGEINHLFHGSIENRKYSTRVKILSENEFNPRQDISIDSNKLWKWNNLKFKEKMKQYMLARQED